jgi:alpha-D-xyloside xylohydrolase
MNKRTYGLIRASNAGGVSFPYVIYNDYYDHKNFVTALINSSFSGVLWTPEVRSSESSEEWLRRFQSNVFSPLAMINAWSDGTKPWTFGDVEEYVKEYALLRMKMMPYWYSEFAKYHFEGTPPFRAMNLENGFMQSLDTKETNALNYAEATHSDMKDQYMAGENLLVAPMFTGEIQRSVVLPKGNWYDFYTGEYVGNGEVITVQPGLSKMPVFVKDGGIIPMMPAILHSPKPGQQVNLEIRYYGKKPSTYMLYDDDGTTFDYQKGQYSWRKIKFDINAAGEMVGSISDPVVGKPNSFNNISYVYMTK